MKTSTKWQFLLAKIAGECSNRQPRIVECVFELELECEGIARSRMQQVLEANALGRLVDDTPVQPTRQPVTGITPGYLVDRKLVCLAAKLILAIGKPIRPGQQRLAAATVCHVLDSVTVEHGLTVALEF